MHISLHTNSVKASCYLLQYLFNDRTPREVLYDIGREIDASFPPDADRFDLPSMDTLVRTCPTLNAAINETLRLCTSTTSGRVVSHDTTLAGRTLYAGARVIMPTLHLHRSSEIWGADPEIFRLNRERWVVGGDIVAHQDGIWRPFGGGHTSCQGCLLAKREMLAFVALIMRRLKDVRIIGQHPGPDLQKVSLGVMEPAIGWEDVRLVFEV